MDANQTKRKTLATIVSLACFAVICGMALPKLMTADPTAGLAGNPGAGPSNLFPSVLFASGLVLGGFFLLGRWFARRKPVAKATVKPAGPFVRKGTLPVGRGIVHLVQVGSTTFLVGTDAMGMRSMLELPTKPAIPEDETADAEDEIVEAQPVVIAQRVTVTIPPTPEQRGQFGL
jgi:hypothetical protein